VGIIVRTKCCSSSGCLFGSCTKVPITKYFIHAVKHAHSEYELFLENQRKQALLEEEEEKQKKEEAEEAKRVEQRTRKHLHEPLAEEAQLQMAQIAEQETVRQLILEALQKLSEAVQGKAKNLQGAKVAQAMLSMGNEKMTACTKLADIKHEKEIIEEKLKQESCAIAKITTRCTLYKLVDQMSCCGDTAIQNYPRWWPQWPAANLNLM